MLQAGEKMMEDVGMFKADIEDLKKLSEEIIEKINEFVKERVSASGKEIEWKTGSHLLRVVIVGEILRLTAREMNDVCKAVDIIASDDPAETALKLRVDDLTREIVSLTEYLCKKEFEDLPPTHKIYFFTCILALALTGILKRFLEVYCTLGEAFIKLLEDRVFGIV